MLFLSSADFFCQNHLFKKIFQEHYQKFCWPWSGSKLFAKVISRQQKSPKQGKCLKLELLIIQMKTLVLCLFVLFDSLRTINNLSFKQGRVFLGWTSTKLGCMCLAQGPQRSDAVEARTRCRLISSQAFYHWATALTSRPMHFESFNSINVSRDLWFPTKWHFDKCRHRWACAAFCKA